MRFHRMMLSAVLLTAPVVAENQTPYRVTLTISDNGSVVGQPTILLQPGEPGSVEASDKYRADITVNALAGTEDQVALSTRIALPVDGALAPVASPSFTIKMDQTAAIEIPGNSTARSLRVEATISR